MTDMGGYLGNTGRADRISAGERMTPVSTSTGDFRVRTSGSGTTRA